MKPGSVYGGMVRTSPDWFPERRGRASGAVRPPVSSQGRPPSSVQITSGSGARAHSKTLPPHTPHRTSHTPSGRSLVCGQGALHRANLRPSLRAAELNAGQRADDVECAAVASRRRRPGSEEPRVSVPVPRQLPLVGAPRQAMAGAPRPRAPFVTMPTARGRYRQAHASTRTHCSEAKGEG